MLPKQLSIECELHEDVHLGCLLADDQLAVVGRRELIQAEEAQVGKDLEQSRIIAVCSANVLFEEDFSENLK